MLRHSPVDLPPLIEEATTRLAKRFVAAAITTAEIKPGAPWPQVEKSPPGRERVHMEVIGGDQENRRSAYLVTVECAKGWSRIDALREHLRHGLLALATDPPLANVAPADKSNTCIVTDELAGIVRSSGIGTATTSLARALARAGHHVTVVYCGHFNDTDRTPEQWIDDYRQDGIALHCLDTSPREGLLFDFEYLRRPWLVCEYLRELEKKDGAYHTIHFPECNGLAYYAIQAKKAGLAFAETILGINTHGSTRWHLDGNLAPRDRVHHWIADHIEPYCIERCDVLHAPSHYLIDWAIGQGWKLPDRVLRMPYVQPDTARFGEENGGDSEEEIPADGRRERVRNLRELVLFGRQETRKGVVVLCDALDLLAQMDPSESGVPADFGITFLGKSGKIDGGDAAAYIEDRAKDWPWPHKIVTDLDQAGAARYLKGAGRLALMPSLIDNYPNTVMECLGMGVPFLASRCGGIPEMIHARDVPEVTFASPPGFDWGAPLGAAIVRAMKQGIRPAAPAFECRPVEEAWIDWHGRIAAAQKPIDRPDGASFMIVGSGPQWPDEPGHLFLVPDGERTLPDPDGAVARALGGGIDLIGCMAADEASGEEPATFAIAFPSWLPGAVPELAEQTLAVSALAAEKLKRAGIPCSVPAILASIDNLELEHLVLSPALVTKSQETRRTAPIFPPMEDLPPTYRRFPQMLADLRARLLEKEHALMEMQWRVDEGYDKISQEKIEVATELHDAKSMLDRLEETFEKEFAILRSRLDELEAQVAGIREESQNRLGGHDDWLKGHEDRHGSQEERINAHQEQLDFHREQIDAHANRFEEIFTSLNDRLAKRDDKLAALKDAGDALREELKQLEETGKGGLFGKR